MGLSQEARTKSLRYSVQGGADVIRKEAWPFYRTISGVRLCWELGKPKGPKGLHRALERMVARYYKKRHLFMCELPLQSAKPTERLSWASNQAEERG